MHGVLNQHQVIGIKELTYGYQNCNTNHILIFDGYVKVRGSSYSKGITWINIILNHIDTRVTFPRYECFCMAYRPLWYK